MAIKVIKTNLPSESILHNRIAQSDFIDCYAVQSSMPVREAAEVIVQFPQWAQFLLGIRRIITTPFGLSNDGPPAEDKVGAFPVELDSENEFIAGFDDKHLDFRVSVFSKLDQVFLATWVHPHNLAGRLYLRAILPFHVMIARDALKRVAQLS